MPGHYQALHTLHLIELGSRWRLQGVMDLFTSYTVYMAEAFAKYKGKDGRFPELLGMHFGAMATSSRASSSARICGSNFLGPQQHLLISEAALMHAPGLVGRLNCFAALMHAALMHRSRGG